MNQLVPEEGCSKRIGDTISFEAGSRKGFGAWTLNVKTRISLACGRKCSFFPQKGAEMTGVPLNGTHPVLSRASPLIYKQTEQEFDTSVATENLTRWNAVVLSFKPI
jgi:hypothetical protein